PRPKPEAMPTSGSVPKAVYLQILRLMRMASNQDQRRVIRTLSVLLHKRQGRNEALYLASRQCFREIIASGAIKTSGATTLLVEASKINGYLAKDGEEAIRVFALPLFGLATMILYSQWKLFEPTTPADKHVSLCSKLSLTPTALAPHVKQVK